jgi:hypothetical protein
MHRALSAVKQTFFSEQILRKKFFGGASKDAFFKKYYDCNNKK